MAKHGKQLLDDTKNTIVQLMEGGYRASEVANILNKGNNKITELRAIFQRESQNS